jgi:hypothetical protein
MVPNYIRQRRRRSGGADLGEMISLEETERNLKTMSSWVHLSSSAQREIAQGLLTRARQEQCGQISWVNLAPFVRLRAIP